MTQITNSLELQQHLAGLLRNAGHPEIVEVAEPNNRQTVVVRGMRENAPGKTGDLILDRADENYIGVAHVGRTGHNPPAEPSWPGFPAKAGR
jgi:hypothetical protein